jgi:hypothetical protein
VLHHCQVACPKASSLASGTDSFRIQDHLPTWAQHTRRRPILLLSPRASSATSKTVHTAADDDGRPLDLPTCAQTLYSSTALPTHWRRLSPMSADSATCKTVHSAVRDDYRLRHGSRRGRQDDTRDCRYATRLARRRARAWARTRAYHPAVWSCVGQQYVHNVYPPKRPCFTKNRQSCIRTCSSSGLR